MKYVFHFCVIFFAIVTHKIVSNDAFLVDPPAYSKGDISFDEILSAAFSEVKVKDVVALFEDRLEIEALIGDVRLLAESAVEGLRAEVDVNRCSVCKSAAILLLVLSNNMTYSDLENLIVKGCEVLLKPLGYKVDPMCNTVRIQLPSIVYVVQQLRTPTSICDYLNACVLRTNKTKSFTHIYDRRLHVETTPLPTNDELRIVHITDLHVEPSYEENTNTNCGLPVCCLNSLGKGTAGPYGDYKCNIPMKTVEIFLQSVKKMKPDLILFSGDIPPHTLWEETYESQVDCTKMLTATISKILPDIPVYPNIGNHEFYPTNLFSVKHLTESKPFLKEFNEAWRAISNFTQDDENNINAGGFYSKVIHKGLRLISFNTNYMYTMNFFNVLNDNPLMGQRTEVALLKNFLRDQLNKTKLSNEKVILLYHHPPGNSDFIVLHSRWLEQVLLEFSQQIVLMPVGHTHYDEFKMVYDVAGVPRGVILVSPSLTTKSARNPSMRLYRLNSVHFNPVDYEHYYLDLNTAYENTTSDDMVKKLYSAKEEYGLKDLSPASWDQLLTNLATDDELFRRHLRHSQAEALSEEDSKCEGRCRDKYICRMRSFNYDEYLDCLPTNRKPNSSTQPTTTNGIAANTIACLRVILSCVAIFFL